MVKLTRNGVCYDLRNTPYKHTVEYNDSKTIFSFSSELNKERFVNRLNENRKTMNSSLSNKYGVIVELNKLADIDLYTKTEKRGFYIVANGRIVEWLEEIVINHEQILRKN